MVDRVLRALAASQKRCVAAAIFSAVALAGCGPATSDPDPEPSATSTDTASAAPIDVPDGTPEITGFSPVFAVQYTEDEGPGAEIGGKSAGQIGSADSTSSAEPTGTAEPTASPEPTVTPSADPTATDEPAASTTAGRVDGAIRSGDYLLVYANNEGSITHQVSAYDLTTGDREWSRVDPNWLECHAGDPSVCISVEYVDGAWQNASAYVFDESGTLESLGVGGEGTFSFVGVSDEIAYFLTWDGTHSVHMTGFDPTGVPVIDKNLRESIPQPRDVQAIDTWIGGGRALIAIPGQEPGIYVANSNAYANYSLATPCISTEDGIACMDATSPDVLRAIDSVGREKWSVELGSAQLLSSAEFSGSLDELQSQLGEAEDGDGSSSSEKYLVITGDNATTLEKDGSKLDMGERGTVNLGTADLTGVDLWNSATLLTVSESVEGVGQASPPQIVSSILVGADGEVISRLSNSRAKELADQDLLGGETVLAHTLTWSDDQLIYTDQTTGIVAVYQAG